MPTDFSTLKLSVIIGLVMAVVWALIYAFIGTINSGLRILGWIFIGIFAIMLIAGIVQAIRTANIN